MPQSFSFKTYLERLFEARHRQDRALDVIIGGVPLRVQEMHADFLIAEPLRLFGDKWVPFECPSEIMLVLAHITQVEVLPCAV